ncbi:MAG: ribosomal protein [Candidatus Parcubacteria bacterium]|jgi:large subunit ribosomal protein L6
MSRIGLKPILFPEALTVSVENRVVTVKGPKGTLTVPLPPDVSATVTPERAVQVTIADTENVGQRSRWGLARQLVANAVAGVQKPFQKSLEFIGVGYRVALAGNVVKMEVGFSHPVDFPLPAGIEAAVEKQTLTLTGIDKQLVGEMAAQIRRVRPPEPYKGKGIKYVDEVIRRKAGKAAKAAA